MNPAHGQCRLSFVSATSLALTPVGGQNLSIAGLPQTVPTAGVTISNAGLAASTLYYVYAAMSAGAMVLELSTTGHTATGGIETKTGDTSRTLVGMVRTTAATQFADDLTNVLVLSWFNRRRKVGKAKFTANRTALASANVFAEVNAEIRVNFLTWGDEYVRQVITGGWTINGAGTGYGYASIDGSTAGQRSWCAMSANTTGAFASIDEQLVAEGYHYGTLIGNCAAGTSALWLGGQNGEVGQSVTVVG